MAQQPPQGQFFSPETQNAFWASFHPDIRAFLEHHEQGEGWTYGFDELPDLFTTLAGALPRVVEVPLTARAERVLHELIPLLAAMPLRQCLSGIAWLDARADEYEGGWGVVCYLHATHIASTADPDDGVLPHARILAERIDMMLRCRISADLFSHIYRLNKGDIDHAA
ncbi:hypothetical protein J2T57_001349 [Natronocella acetinitrilica]|uniref:Uncharacterized protein n=1 Tax=Natronocella acetinitrilica TaxID=414046 RepID=A0AAE3G5J2_9GAMM|nr:hypothetical protein [Natronocella acetinitrilica]MCP1674247.1 hypothetical protein [Natronocella acetinitrilica]